MKRTAAALAMIWFFGAPLPGVSADPNWVLYGRPAGGSLLAYYDKENVVPIGDKMLRVTVKYVYSEEGRKDVITSRKRSELPTGGYEKLAHSIVQYELECRKSQQSIFSVSEIDLDGKELDRYNPPGREWTPVKRGGIGDVLLKKVCK